MAHDAHEGYREYTDRCGYTRSRTLAPGHTQALAPSLWHLSALSGPPARGEPTFSARRDTAAQSDMARDRQQKRCSTRTPGRPPAPGYCRCPGRHAPSRAGRPRTPRPQPLTQAPPLIWLVVSSHLALVTGWLGRAVSHGCPERKAAQTCGCGSGPGSGRSGLARPPGASGETESRRGWGHRGPQDCRFPGGTGRPSARGPGGGRLKIAGTGAPLRSPRLVGL